MTKQRSRLCKGAVAFAALLAVTTTATQATELEGTTNEDVQGPVQVAAAEDSSAWANKAVIGPNVRLGGQYIRQHLEDTPNRNTWEGKVTFGVPLDFGLSGEDFFDNFGWHFRGSLSVTENVVTTTGFLVQPFWRDPEIGYVEWNNEVSFIDINN